MKGRRKKKSPGREYAYYGIKRTRIIVEKLLINPENPESGVEDYKFICCNGKIACVQLDVDRNICHKRLLLSKEWQNLHIDYEYPQINVALEPSPPKQFKEMCEVAERLSENFPHVRVDLYNIDGQIIFGELTFYPSSGYMEFSPDSFDFELGEKFDVSYPIDTKDEFK